MVTGTAMSLASTHLTILDITGVVLSICLLLYFLYKVNKRNKKMLQIFIGLLIFLQIGVYLFFPIIKTDTIVSEISGWNSDTNRYIGYNVKIFGVDIYSYKRKTKN